MSLDFWRHIWESVCTLALGVPSGGWWGGLEKVNSTHPFHIQIHTHMTPLKEAPERHNEAFVRARFLMSPRSSTQIDHLSIALCLKGKCMHASETERGREKDSGRVRKKSYNPNHFFPFSFNTFPPCLLSPTSFPLFLPHPPYPPSLSAEESSLSTGIGAL